MKSTTLLVCAAVLMITGCATPISNVQNFQNVVNAYKADPEPKAAYLAYDHANSWAFGKSISARTLEQAHDAAKQNCENTRLAYGVSAPCSPYYENNDFIRASRPTGAQPSRPGPQRESPPRSVSGTCFSIASNGVVVTANHVIEGASEISITFPDGSQHPARVSSASQRIDIAILSVDATGIPWIPFAPARSYQSGDYIFALGYPVRTILGDEVKFTDGSISALTGIASEAAFMQVSAPVQPGNSGGPILSEQGEVVGVLVSSAAIRPFIERSGSLPQNINWATNIDFVRPLLSFDVPSLPLSDRREAINRAKDATCIVEAKIGSSAESVGEFRFG